MKKSLHAEEQIVVVLKEAETGIPIAHDISDATNYNWKEKYGGIK